MDADETRDSYQSNSEELTKLDTADNPAKDFLYFLFDLFKTGLIVFVLAFSLRYFAVQPFIVDGESMMPNYENNEYLLAEKVSYLTGQPERGDVIVFRYPGNPSVNYIKRIIALPGEKVKIENNQVTITNSTHPSGVVLQEDYLSANTVTATNEGNVFEKTVGENEYFVMGDNRQHSSDSREWGLLPKANIIGRSWLTVIPLNRLHIHSRTTYPNISYWPTVLDQKLV